MLEDFWVTFDIHNAAFLANKEDGIFTKDAVEKLDQITKITEGAELMKVKEGALGLTGHKYFLWKGWGPIAWWDIVEKKHEVINQRSNIIKIMHFICKNEFLLIMKIHLKRIYSLTQGSQYTMRLCL